jgi:hypothetical protein
MEKSVRVALSPSIHSIAPVFPLISQGMICHHLICETTESSRFVTISRSVVSVKRTRDLAEALFHFCRAYPDSLEVSDEQLEGILDELRARNKVLYSDQKFSS